ncbi:hypothetical protein RRG08_014043 [Elysia crispata]|uniref:Secreted protein n=1 Tax=Elysia crispata TaxID=231223 RepID=A0AAE1A0M2_9GAST|nr:hypothetical protein RRG08_014043 [Elysia crispata]
MVSLATIFTVVSSGVVFSAPRAVECVTIWGSKRHSTAPLLNAPHQLHPPLLSHPKNADAQNEARRRSGSNVVALYKVPLHTMLFIV